MNCDHFLPVCEWKLLDRRYNLDAGVRHENIDGSECLRRRVDACINLILIRHIHRYRKRNPFIADLGGGGSSSLEVEICDANPASSGSEALGDSVADSARSAGDGGDLAIELHRTAPLNEIAVDNFAETEREIS